MEIRFAISNLQFRISNKPPFRGGFQGGGGGSFARGGGRRGGNNNAGGPSIQFYTDVQNALNHRNFNNPSGTLTSPNFGLFQSARTQRTVELGVRLNF